MRRADQAADEALRAARNSPTLLLAVLGQAAMLRTRDAHSALQLKPRQFEALATLHDFGSMPQSALGDHLRLAPSGLVVLLNPLEVAGSLRRERVQDNRNRNIVEITRDGAALLGRARTAQMQLDHELLAVLSPRQQAELVEILQRLRDGTTADGTDEGSRWLRQV